MPSTETSPGPSSFEAQPKDEEHLPVYQCSEHADPNTLPASQASPEDVRQFIISVLVSRRQLPIDYARYVAARWHIRSGLELRTYPASMYSELFGSEDGWIIYKEIKPMIDGESQKKAIDHHGPHLSMLALFAYFILSIVFINLKKKDALSDWMGLAGIFVSLLGMSITANLMISAKSSEEKAIGELQEVAERANRRPS
ncbi:hypothetical protein D0864_09248 [Hortaea werneckii]|uniref:Uncharacterized protein n=1 Tax=Hortaea werneckii TaxID=91943 RepID=A0A3M7EPU8_HORWE|nr:hypothetical protein D0864_09248 [Hortaea werneckii]